MGARQELVEIIGVARGGGVLNERRQVGGNLAIQQSELLLARVRASGALTIESTAGLSPAIVNAYLAMKQRL